MQHTRCIIGTIHSGAQNAYKAFIHSHHFVNSYNSILELLPAVLNAHSLFATNCFAGSATKTQNQVVNCGAPVDN